MGHYYPSQRQRGLGVQKFIDKNTVMPTKLAWRVHTNPKKLWSSLLINKYVRGLSLKYHDNHLKITCFIWKSIVIGWSICSDNMRCTLGDSKSISLWEDDWIPYLKPLSTIVHGIFLLNDLNIRVGDIIFGNSWKLEGLWASWGCGNHDKIYTHCN